MKPVTNQYRAFACLQASATPINAAQVAARTGMTVEQADSALSKLVHFRKVRSFVRRAALLPTLFVANPDAVVAPVRPGNRLGPRPRPPTGPRQPNTRELRLQERADECARKHWPMPPCELARILTPRLDRTSEAA